MPEENKQITVSIRKETGKRTGKKLRRQGLLPGIIYGHDTAPIAIVANDRELTRVVGHPSIITINFENNENEKTNVLVKDVQYNYLHSHVIHVDFLKVNMDEKITAKVQLKIVGEAAGVHKGGQTDQISHEVEVECLPGDLPDKLECDVTALNIGDSITIGQIEYPEGVVSTSVNPDVIVVHVVLQRAEESAEEEAGDSNEPEVISKGKPSEE